MQPALRRWTLLTNHGACLVLLAEHSGATVREVAATLQVTERSAARILADLRLDGYISVRRDGRRNRYTVDLDAPLRHPVGRGRRVLDLLQGLVLMQRSPGQCDAIEAVEAIDIESVSIAPRRDSAAQT